MRQLSEGKSEVWDLEVYAAYPQRAVTVSGMECRLHSKFGRASGLGSSSSRLFFEMGRAGSHQVALG